MLGLIEQDAHLRRAQAATRGVLQYCAHLLEGDARKPFDEVVRRGVVFEVFKERGDGHTGTVEQPSSAVPFHVSLDRVAGGPVNHARRIARNRGIGTPNY
jgi:hypothetical protein